MIKSIYDVWMNNEFHNSDKTAVIHNGISLTYKELYSCVCTVAGVLSGDDDFQVNQPIAILLPKSIDCVVMDLACVCVGSPFVNLDIKTPSARIGNILDSIKPSLVITDNKYAGVLQDSGVKVILTDSFDYGSAPADVSLFDRRRAKLIDTDPFCIINTSGSTGTPKGVVLNHKSFFDFMAWADDVFAFDGSEVIGSLSPVVFDIFVFELCMMIYHGSTMIILDASLAMFPAKLLTTMSENKVSFIFWVPSIMVNIANLDLISRLPQPDLKTVWFAGEVFPTKQFLYWFDHLPGVCFVNMYGPIEITLDCTYHIIKERPAENRPLPIGIPCDNTDILILDEDGRRCAAGEEGELCVRGTSLAMGYYNNEEKTSLAFVQNPLNHSYPEVIYKTGDIVFEDENGIIHFRGRRDSLIKHMGYRIELGEIEHILIDKLKMVEYCCAVYNYQKKEIVLYYEKKEDITTAVFRSKLKDVVPSYMIPTKYERMDILPRNTNGKIDRLLLKELTNKEV